MKEARKRPIPVISKVFLHKGILGELGSLLEEVKPFSDQIVLAFMEYTGNAKRILDQFITEEDLRSIPEILLNMNDIYLKKFKSEREWVHLVKDEAFPEFNIVDYILYLDADNIDYVLATPIDGIIMGFRAMNRDFMESFPDILTLANKYGDRDSMVLFECRDVLRKWLDSFYEDEGLDKSKLFSFTNNSVEWKVYERL